MAEALTGTWQGIYFYPPEWEMASCDFVARLVETGSQFFGSITETVSEDIAFQTDQGAYVEGTRDGRSITFVKSYDGSGDWAHKVTYQGELSHDGDEINGKWSITERGQTVTGPFFMTRRLHRAVEEASLKKPALG